MMKVYTKTGDQGQTSLLSKQRVFKDHIRVEAYGTVDEANTMMGLAKSLSNRGWVQELLQPIQEELILLNADLATEQRAAGEPARIAQKQVDHLESIIDFLENKRIPQKYFVTPGNCPTSAALDLARTVVRRAERAVVKLSRTEPETVPVPVCLYLNRLSDLLFVLARCVEQEEIVSLVTQNVLEILDQEGVQLQKQGNTMLEKAKKMLEAAERKACEIHIPMVIAVVDEGGNLVAQERMDGALLASLSLALDKAYTAVALKMSTDKLAEQVTPGQPLFGVNSAGSGRYIVFGGGYPLMTAGLVVGGLGVSGGTVAEDMMVAQAGLKAW
ncbi:ATP:cob(I)alamin adenosyltransferase [Sporomusaceae bacterium BoRhaA]|uniref:cob(I)yrinic acid a,c-diamide adenosyltransferase n=1 Tax=Pelorhabdus rhamnosifermentans TaxID=2772457 RepID=UPI001C05F3C6|nr:cob(I)yrinic acid a,c-diamide adenosyltransferase [Pelorhabdus rhamnosifermentans]MBU2701846.1 ATP:cob(I)alamin adenosyltransferase [Pelorhabdus rhamnosifermentans]